jgi:hypothetical protein
MWRVRGPDCGVDQRPCAKLATVQRGHVTASSVWRRYEPPHLLSQERLDKLRRSVSRRCSLCTTYELRVFSLRPLLWRALSCSDWLRDFNASRLRSVLKLSTKTIDRLLF